VTKEEQGAIDVRPVFREPRILPGVAHRVGVAEIPGLQTKLRAIGKNGFRRHVSVAFGSFAAALVRERRMFEPDMGAHARCLGRFDAYKRMRPAISSILKA
jgi:hypothetical protein